MRDSLSRLDQGVMRVRTYGKPSSLIVACDPALASRWLVPLLPAFRAEHSSIDVWLYSTNEQLDLEVEEVHIVFSALTMKPMRVSSHMRLSLTISRHLTAPR